MCWLIQMHSDGVRSTCMALQLLAPLAHRSSTITERDPGSGSCDKLQPSVRTFDDGTRCAWFLVQARALFSVLMYVLLLCIRTTGCAIWHWAESLQNRV